MRYYYSLISKQWSKRPSSAPFISGDSFRALADHVFEPGRAGPARDTVREGQVVFCQADYVDQMLSDENYPSEGPTTIILGNADANHRGPELERKFPDSRVFAQNLDHPTQRVTPLPIGLENALRSGAGNTKLFRKLRGESPPRIPRIMWTFAEENNPAQREKARKALSELDSADYLGRLSVNRHHKSLASYLFVASPPGNGQDTHRTWEAMYLRSIPIVIRSSMTEAFFEMGLPMWLVEDYAELCGVRSEDLSRKYRQLAHRFDSESLWLRHWAKEIFSAN